MAGPPCAAVVGRIAFVIARIRISIRTFELSIGFYADTVRTVAGGKLQDKARAARNDVYRQHILEAAEQVFAESGFDNAKLQDISKLAEVSMGTIYAIFASKEELFRGILDTRGADLLEVARASTQVDADPRV